MMSEKMINAVFPILREYADLFNISIDVFDASGVFIKTTEIISNSHLTTQIKNSRSSHEVNELVENGEKKYYCVIPISNNKDIGYIVPYSENASSIKTQSAAIKIAIDSFVQNFAISFSDESLTNGFNPLHKQLVYHLLKGTQNQELISKMIQLCNLDASLSYLPVVIDCSFKTNDYFNINLNLGYSATLEKSRIQIEEVLSGNKYLNSQDVLAQYTETTYIILKSFLQVSNSSRIYTAMDLICQNLINGLSKIELLDVRVAYGSLSKSIYDIRSSYREAMSLLTTGKSEMPNQHFYNIEELAFSSICQTLPVMLVNKVVIPKLQLLQKEYPSSYLDMLTTAKTYAECCMNYSKTSAELGIHRNTLTKRLENFCTTTKLDIINNYKDCVLATLMEKYQSLELAKLDKNKGVFND